MHISELKKKYSNYFFFKQLNVKRKESRFGIVNINEASETRQIILVMRFGCGLVYLVSVQLTN